MFYCDTCMKKNEWPGSFMSSYGKCEVCGKIDRCNDRPSYTLPVPPKFGPKNEELWK